MITPKLAPDGERPPMSEQFADFVRRRGGGDVVVLRRAIEQQIPHASAGE